MIRKPSSKPAPPNANNTDLEGWVWSSSAKTEEEEYEFEEYTGSSEEIPEQAPSSHHSPPPKPKKNTDCFVTSTEQFKNLYIQIASRYAQRINEGDPVQYTHLIGENSLARKILTIAASKINDLETHENDNIPSEFRRDLVKAIGELAAQFIDLALKYNRTDNLLDLYNEALHKMLRLKGNTKPADLSKCILDFCRAASDQVSNLESPTVAAHSVSVTSSSSESRAAYQLNNWYPKPKKTPANPVETWQRQKATRQEWTWNNTDSSSEEEGDNDEEYEEGDEEEESSE